MSSPSGSTKVIVIALLANLGIALAKTVGAIFSGSASLFAEAIHSFVDCANQVLLLLGAKAARKAPTKSHPLGYGRESFFWSFIVTILLFSMGGLFAIYEGVHKLDSSEAMQYPWLVLIILAVGIALEGYSFRVCLKEIRTVNQFDNLRQWYRRTTASGLLVIFTEDAGALIGLVMAAVCVSLSWGLGDPAWDAYGSIMIGVLLVTLAGFLGVEIKSLLIGEASSPQL
jgi:cation diffusion facilitator family transporter